MSSITSNYSPDNNFWDFYPQYATVDPFKSLKGKDRTKNKSGSSTLMWAIAFVYHPKSELYNMSDKFERIAVDMLGEAKGFKWSKYKALSDAFINITLTTAEKGLINWENGLKDRDSFLAKQEYHFGYSKETEDGFMEYKSNVKELDEMRGRTAKLYQEFFKIKKELEDEDVARGKGQKISSMGDSGEI